jgi:hypothetical protein
MGCHVADGSGAAGKVPSLRESLGSLAAFPAGRRYLVQVPGVSQSPLDDGEVALLLNWMIRSFSTVSAAAQPMAFSAAEVARYRSGRLENVAATRARLLAIGLTSAAKDRVGQKPESRSP